MNKVILSGRLVRDAEVRYSQGDEPMAIARGTLAVDRRGKEQDGQPTADFINLLAFKNRAEFLEKYGRQGTKFIIEGKWQTGSYTNRDGVKVYTNECVIDNIEFAESKKSEEETPSRPAPSMATGDGFMNIPDGIEDEGFPFN